MVVRGAPKLRLKRFSLRAGVSAFSLLACGAVQAATFSFGHTGTVQTGTVTQAGVCELSPGGARGGEITWDTGSGFVTNFGGIGATVGGRLFLDARTSFSILVGGDGASGTDSGVTYLSGGGGGITWFDKNSDGTIEAVAGRDGGASLGIGGVGIMYSLTYDGTDAFDTASCCSTGAFTGALGLGGGA